jgi:NADH-quinone oxidoreductase subunit L
VYVTRNGEPARRFTEANPGFHQLVADKWRVDELYDEAFVGSADSLAELAKAGDKWVVDGILARFSAFLVATSGSLLRYLQNGRVQAYSAFMVLGVAMIAWLLLAPRAQARTVSDHAAGAYSVNAAPGLGYRYRWDANGDGVWDSDEYADNAEVKFNLEPDASRTVRLEVKNAFGRTDWTEIVLSRPKTDRSGDTEPGMVDVEMDGNVRPAGQKAPPPNPGAANPPAGEDH